MKAFKAEQPPSLEEQALYHNLCLLGIFQPGHSKGADGTECGRTAFRRSNNKALELVLYSLFTVYRGKAKAQKVRWVHAHHSLCYPAHLCVTAHSMHARAAG